MVIPSGGFDKEEKADFHCPTIIKVSGHIRVTFRLGSSPSPRDVIDREVVICMSSAYYARWPLLIGTKSPVWSSAMLTTHQPQTAPLGSFDLSQSVSLAATADLNSPQTGLGPRSKGESKVPRYSQNDDGPQRRGLLCVACVSRPTN